LAYWKSEHFKALQKDWYKRLKESGFQDHEKFVNGEHELKELRPYKSDKCERDDDSSNLKRSMKECYYILLGQCVASYNFKSEVHRVILTLHAEGMRAYLIVRELKSLGTPRHRENVRYVIRKYEMKWGLRKYNKRQLGRMSV
jgi:hypothetical protein